MKKSSSCGQCHWRVLSRCWSYLIPLDYGLGARCICWGSIAAPSCNLPKIFAPPKIPLDFRPGFDLAQNFVAKFATRLRGPDALHLAIASNNGIDEIRTLDDGMLFAARKLKLKVKRK